jgi:hypothetical protein
VSDLLDNPKRWRERAEEARTIVAGMSDPEIKRIMQSVAESHEQFAQRAEQRVRKSEAKQD